MPFTKIIPILFGEGKLEEKVKKLNENGVDAKIIINGEYPK